MWHICEEQHLPFLSLLTFRVLDRRIVMNSGRRLEGKEKFAVQLRVALMILFPLEKRTC